jgi:hypothetical protein
METGLLFHVVLCHDGGCHVTACISAHPTCFRTNAAVFHVPGVFCTLRLTGSAGLFTGAHVKTERCGICVTRARK